MESNKYNFKSLLKYFEEWETPEEIAKKLTLISERLALWCTYTDGLSGEYVELRESIQFLQRLRETIENTAK